MRDGKRIVITYGTYDLLHFGHVALLERAKALGDYLIVGITSDAFDRERGKLNVRQSLAERVEAVEATGLADKIVVEEYRGQKISDIKEFDVDVFTVGSDWTGKFDYLKKYCEVVYLDRTKGVSSTELRERDTPDLRLGCIGVDYLAARVLRESVSVGGLSVRASFGEPVDDESAKEFAARNIQHFDDLDCLLASVDAVYVSVPVAQRCAIVRRAVEAGVHVLCEGPLFLSRSEARQIRDFARDKGIVVREAVKTRHFPAFRHLKLLLESGVIGEVKDVDAAFSHVFDALDKTDRFQGSFYDMASYILLPAFDLLGTAYLSADLIGSFEGDFCPWAKCNLLFEEASATLRVGRGMKTEGDLVVTGTDGYVYVPAPWWKMEYFELRSEDLRDTKKYYYECAGEGQRYELFSFVRDVGKGVLCSEEEGEWDRIMATTRLVEQFHSGSVSVLHAGAFPFGGGETVNR